MLSKRKKKEKENVKSQLMSPLKNYETRKHDAILKNAYRKSVIVIKLYNNHIYIYYTYNIYLIVLFLPTRNRKSMEPREKGKKEKRNIKYHHHILITYEKKFSYNFTCKKTIPFPASSDKTIRILLSFLPYRGKRGKFSSRDPAYATKTKKEKEKRKKKFRDLLSHTSRNDNLPLPSSMNTYSHRERKKSAEKREGKGEKIIPRTGISHPLAKPRRKIPSFRPFVNTGGTEWRRK